MVANGLNVTGYGKADSGRTTSRMVRKTAMPKRMPDSTGWRTNLGRRRAATRKMAAHMYAMPKCRSKPNAAVGIPPEKLRCRAGRWPRFGADEPAGRRYSRRTRSQIGCRVRRRWSRRQALAMNLFGGSLQLSLDEERGLHEHLTSTAITRNRGRRLSQRARGMRELNPTGRGERVVRPHLGRAPSNSGRRVPK